jgi:hypothetical protein
MTSVRNPTPYYSPLPLGVPPQHQSILNMLAGKTNNITLYSFQHVWMSVITSVRLMFNTDIMYEMMGFTNSSHSKEQLSPTV